MTFTTLISAAMLRDLMGKPEIAIIDCRFDLMNPDGGRRAYLEGHIPGARYADLNKDLSAPITATSGRHPLPTPGDFAGTLVRLGIGRATQVIAYDDGAGAFAARFPWERAVRVSMDIGKNAHRLPRESKPAAAHSMRL